MGFYIESEEILSEWRLFKRALAKKTKTLVRGKKLTEAQTLYRKLKQRWKLLNILPSLPVGTATVERSCSLCLLQVAQPCQGHTLYRLTIFLV